MLTEDAALRLELVLGASADSWLTREARYRGRVARRKAARFHAEYVRWLDELPVKFPMARRNRECTGEYNSRFPNRRHRCRTAILPLAAILRHVLQAAVSGGCEWIDPRTGFIAMNNNSFHECGFNHADTA